jgi:hypothetical protein
MTDQREDVCAVCGEAKGEKGEDRLINPPTGNSTRLEITWTPLCAQHKDEHDARQLAARLEYG